MTGQDVRVKSGVIVLLAISMAACPLALAQQISFAQPQYSQPQPFTPPPASFEAIFTATFEVPTPISTLGPGQYYDGTDQNRPTVRFIEKGDNRFGYGPLKGSDELYAVWTTDSEGTHYLIVHKESEFLRGTIDSATDSRFPNGIDELIRQRGEAQVIADQQITQRDTRDRSAGRSFSLGVGIAIAGGIACVITTLGVCGVIIALGGGFILAGFASQDAALSQGAAAQSQTGVVDSINDSIIDRFNARRPGELTAPAGGG